MGGIMETVPILKRFSAWIWIILGNVSFFFIFSLSPVHTYQFGIIVVSPIALGGALFA